MTDTSIQLRERIFDLEQQLKAMTLLVEGESARKLEAMGRLAGGVAHDFNNYLTVILGQLEFARESGGLSPDAKRCLDEATGAAGTAAALAGQLLAFARQKPVMPQPLVLSESVSKLSGILKALLNERIELKLHLKPRIDPVLADPSQVEQVLVNLVLNAREAMPQGGLISIETDQVTLDQAYARTHAGVTPGPHVMLAVHDSGVGMDEHALKHAFEPFFSTEGQGRGSGLGLASCYGIVKQAGGHIWAYSEVGKGSSFKIYLPPYSGGAQPAARAAEKGAASRGGETVLLVEDEAALLRLTSQALSHFGYKVLGAEDGEKALKLEAENPGVIDLLISDVVTPRMGTKALVNEFSKRRPKAKVLYISGYSADVIAFQGLTEDMASFLPKPFTLAALGDKVREVLGRRGLR